MRLSVYAPCLVALVAARWARADPVDADFRFFEHPRRGQSPPQTIPAEAQVVRRGFRWRSAGGWAWLVGELEIPAEIDGAASSGKSVGVRIACAAGGEVFVGGALRVRYEGGSPALVLAAEDAVPGRRVSIAIDMRASGGAAEENVLSRVEWVLLESRRARERLELTADAARTMGRVPDGLIGAGDDGAIEDLTPATVAALRACRFRWFRLEGALTSCVRPTEGGARPGGAKVAYDFVEFDRRIDLVRELGAEPIICASYMPAPLAAVPGAGRFSAPLRFEDWEDLCFEVARHALATGRPVAAWEVWSEPDAGRLAPCPCDSLEDGFAELYSRALGSGDNPGPPDAGKSADAFQAYLKLYAATARGVRRADSRASVVGPATSNVNAFARGLALYCADEKLPLDWLSWHGGFARPEVLRAEAASLRALSTRAAAREAAEARLLLVEPHDAETTDPGLDHELGAARLVNAFARALIPAGVDRPCLSRLKQDGVAFRGDPALLLGDDSPKPRLHAARVLNSLAGRWVDVAGGDDEVSGLAARDEKAGRITVVIVNHAEASNLRRRVRLSLRGVPASRCIERTIDATRSNVYSAPARAALEVTREWGVPAGGFVYEATLAPHSVTWLELVSAAN
jgi:hypothetical protein